MGLTGHGNGSIEGAGVDTGLNAGGDAGDGIFITLEGIEGAGKTSQVDGIVTFLNDRGIECATTREPGGTKIGAQIRQVLLNPENRDLDANAELLLYVADRVQHIKTVIEPNLRAGRTVLCDRFWDATMVYQGYARGLDKELIRDLHRLVCGDLKPGLTLLFDLDPEVGLMRAWRDIHSGGRTDQESRFEKEELAFHEKVRHGYLDLAHKEPKRFKIIHAGEEPHCVAAEIEATLAAFLRNYNRGAA
jgi:dTMP kinase